MIDPITFYTGLKFWLPLASAFALTIKAYGTAKTNVSEWADKLLNNHLTHIESATGATHTETMKTNTLLASAALRDMEVSQKVEVTHTTLIAHNEKEEQVWQAVLNTLTVLEDRTARQSRTPRSPRKKRATVKRRK